jgi:hypothetical protein
MSPVALCGREDRSAGAVDLAEYQVRREQVLAGVRCRASLGNGRICGVGGVILNDATVFEVRDVEIAVGVDRDACRPAQRAGAGQREASRAIAVVVVHVGLADHQIGSLPVGKRFGVVPSQHAAVQTIDDIKMIRRRARIDRNTVSFRGVADTAVAEVESCAVDKIRGVECEYRLSQHLICANVARSAWRCHQKQNGQNDD